MEKRPVDVAVQIFETELQIISCIEINTCRILIRRIYYEIQ